MNSVGSIPQNSEMWFLKRNRFIYFSKLPNECDGKHLGIEIDPPNAGMNTDIVGWEGWENSQEQGATLENQNHAILRSCKIYLVSFQCRIEKNQYLELTSLAPKKIKSSPGSWLVENLSYISSLAQFDWVWRNLKLGKWCWLLAAITCFASDSRMEWMIDRENVSPPTPLHSPTWFNICPNA